MKFETGYYKLNGMAVLIIAPKLLITLVNGKWWPLSQFADCPVTPITDTRNIGVLFDYDYIE